MAIDRDEIRSTVTQRYGAKAERALAGADMIALEAVSAEACCGPECCVPGDLTEEERSLIKGLYAREQVAGLPDGAIEAAAGCGNPTAIAEIRPGETVLDLGSGGGIDCFLAAKQVGPAGRVIGIDITPKMVGLASALISAEKPA